MSPAVPRPPVPLSDVVVLDGAGACVEGSGAGWGSGANGLGCGSARAGAVSARSAITTVTRATTARRLIISEQSLQFHGVLDGEALPVVVVVGEDLAAAAQLGDALGPLVDLGVGVVAAPAALGPVEADEGEVGGRRRAGQRATGVVGGGRRAHVIGEQRVDVVGEPRALAELKRVAAGRQLVQRGA